MAVAVFRWDTKLWQDAGFPLETPKATTLEDYGLTPDEIRLWARAFDILCGRATHIVAVIEDFDGGYVWEMGLLFAPT